MASLPPRTIRAYLFPTLVAYTGDKFPPEQGERIRELAPALFDRVRRGDTKGDAPIEEMIQLYQAFETVTGSVEATYEHVLASADGIGQEALRSFLRLVIKFMPTQVFARKCCDFFRKDHSFGRVSLESFDGDGKRFVLLMEEMAGYPYCAPGMMGVLRSLMRAMGHTNVTVVEELHPPPEPQDHDHYRIVVSW